MKVFAVLDTNVIVSALLARNATSATVKLIDAVRENMITPLFNDEILDEYNDVLHRAKFAFPVNDIEAFINLIKEIGIHSSRIHSDENFPDSKDVVFYEVALSQIGH